MSGDDIHEGMTLEDLADLIRATSNNTNRRIDVHRNETSAQYMTLHSNIDEVWHALDVAETVVEMRRRIEALKAAVSRLKRGA